MILLILMQIVAAAANAVMDVLRFRWHMSIFAKWSYQANAWGKFWEYWAGWFSWDNKYEGKGLWGALLRGPLVAVTDAWHFAQMLMFTAYQSTIICLAPLPELFTPTIDFILYLMMTKVIHGVVFELFFTRILINPRKS